MWGKDYSKFDSLMKTKDAKNVLNRKCWEHSRGFRKCVLFISISSSFIHFDIWSRSEEGPYQTEEVSPEAAHPAVGQRQRIYQRSSAAFSHPFPDTFTEHLGWNLILMWPYDPSPTENVFGCHLHNLCIQEKTRVPSFVEKCIRTVEKRGVLLLHHCQPCCWVLFNISMVVDKYWIFSYLYSDLTVI